MARMKTGRLTTKTTPPEKYIVTSKRETVQPRELSSREAKYNADMEAGEKYKSDLATYNKQMAIYNKDEATKLSKGGKNYGYGAGIDKNSRTLNPTELAEFNKKQKTADYNPDQPDYAEVRVNKGIKDPTDPGGFHGYYKKPIAPKPPSPPNERDMPMDRLPMNKITSIKSRGKSVIKEREKPEPSDFVNPGKPRKIGKDISMNPLAGGAYTKGSGKRYVKQVIGSIGKTGENSRGYKKEERLFKAKASTGAANLDISDMSSKDIKGIRKDYLKKDLSAARTDNSLKPEERAKKIAAAKMEIKQSRQGQRYTTKMEKGKLSYFTPGYNEGKNKNEESRNDRGRIYEYKSSQDNINNKNTIDAKLKAIGEKAKSKPGSFGSMPTS